MSEYFLTAFTKTVPYLIAANPVNWGKRKYFRISYLLFLTISSFFFSLQAYLFGSNRCRALHDRISGARRGAFGQIFLGSLFLGD